MTRRSSRAAYDARMHRVLQYIDEHISEELVLETLAAVASFSPYHFHRVFAAWAGERLGEYLRRRRVEIGAGRLAAQPALSVLDVGLSVGFGSGEAFSRAFKAHFGASPTSWRRGVRGRSERRNLGQMNGNPNQARRTATGQDDDSCNATEHPMQVRLETLKPVHIAYLRHLGPYGGTIERFWRESVHPWMVENALLRAPRYGISHDDPSITDAARCRYDACVEVEASAQLSGNALRTRLPGGRYAVVDYSGPATEIGQAWSRLLREWLPESGMQLDARPCFEYYPTDADYDEETGRFSCRICVPVAPL
ncbi:MAG: AraC family transcriptional regulator [Ectothiorhodospiraceae bacterium]|nr:AraC family transcriptional regulator [Chromatiales bacterium]MCP5154182.1 AraC family transcriptional regulator [Ectothiorhodospiraceae bacterium]